MPYVRPSMVNAPSPDEAARRKIRGQVESYLEKHGKEDSLNGVAGSLKAHSPEAVQSVFETFERRWRENPDMDDARLDTLKARLRAEMPGLTF